MTCRIDLDGDGTDDDTIAGCTSAHSRSQTYLSAGTKVLRLTVSDDSGHTTSATTSVSVSGAAAEPYNITVVGSPTTTATQLSYFTSAAAHWQAAIGAGLPSETFSVSANECTTGQPAWSGTVDDLLIYASVQSIDGPGGVLAMAGPCLVRDGNSLPVYGVMFFDSADVATLISQGLFDDTVTHEMGHVLGFGTVWDSNVTGYGTSDPRFVGPIANGVWSKLGQVGLIPVENSGAAGTANAHWRESVFNDELMTGYIGATNPMSAVTIGAFGDLGYQVNLGAAEPYGLPDLQASRSAASRTAANADIPGHEIAIEPIRSV